MADENASVNQIQAGRKSVRRWLLATGSIAVLAIGAGLTGHSTLAFWCLPIFVVVGVAANAKSQAVKRMVHPEVTANVGRQVGEGILLAFLALFFVVLLFILWWWHALGEWHG
jgi:hypothetical protein